MAKKKLKEDRGIQTRVHPSFKKHILDQMDNEVKRKLGVNPEDIDFNNVAKTKILTNELMKQRFTFMVPKDDHGTNNKKGRKKNIFD
jgi:hypothetical protein